jgi:hypothetical protein
MRFTFATSCIAAVMFGCSAGEAGSDGQNGHDSLVAFSTEPPGANCLAGGTRIDAGLDDGVPSGTPRDGVLDAGEIDETTYSCNASVEIDITAPSGTLITPGGGSYWANRAYQVAFGTPTRIYGLGWWANLGTSDFVRAYVWDPAGPTTLATGSDGYGTGALGWHHSRVDFTPEIGKVYAIGFYVSNGSTVFPRKNIPTFPYTVGNVTVSGNYSSNSTTAPAYPADTNSWAPFVYLDTD